MDADGVKEGFRQGPWAIVAPLIRWRDEPLPNGPGILATFNGNMDKQQIALDNIFVCHARTSNPDLAARVLQLVELVRERDKQIATLNQEPATFRCDKCRLYMSEHQTNCPNCGARQDSE